MSDVDCIEVLRSLANHTRIRIIKALFEKDSEVNEIAERLGISQYNVSKHLRVLKSADIVDAHTTGVHRKYFIEPKFRGRLRKGAHLLDFGCCSFRFDSLPAKSKPGSVRWLNEK